MSYNKQNFKDLQFFLIKKQGSYKSYSILTQEKFKICQKKKTKQDQTKHNLKVKNYKF